MAVDRQLKKLEWEMVSLAGPLAPFVIKKQIKDMGLKMETFPEDKLSELIDRVVDSGVYDDSIKPRTKKALKKKILGS